MTYFDRAALVQYLETHVRLDLRYTNPWSHVPTPIVWVLVSNEWRACQTAAEVAEAFADDGAFMLVKLGNFFKAPTVAMLEDAVVAVLPFPENLAVTLVIDGLRSATAERTAGREKSAQKILIGTGVVAIGLLVAFGAEGGSVAG